MPEQKNSVVKEYSMKNQEVYRKITQKLEDFETLDPIRPTAEWNESVLQKISSSQRKRKSAPPLLYVLTLLAIVLLNVGFYLKISLEKPEYSRRTTVFRVVADNLFVVPIPNSR